MGPHSFFCLDGHTCGNPVRLVAGGAPRLTGATMSERRADFIARFDWIRRALMFEPRGHDVMSGAILYPPLRADCDAAILFIEVSGALPMCGHGTIGTVTMALEHGLITPAREGEVALDAPAGRVVAQYRREGRFIEEVRLYNVPAFLAAADLRVTCPGLGDITVDIAYGGNFYAIVEKQPGYDGLESLSADAILRLSPGLRDAVNRAIAVTHPEDETIGGVSHILWAGAPRDRRATARNAVFYGARAIDRSPCGTGTSARMAQLVARGRLRVGDDFIHESIIGSLFEGRVESAATVGGKPAIRPSIAGWARLHGLNTILVDPRDPFWAGFQVG
ncbi:MAG: 4-hydroxyproline epimerase [Acidibrevibacterium sp.]|jgi:4-hydroxyproline epimerase|uniref:4-hydroxyproline epimerase n=1 Tax=Acidibrevibacterium fodinaquatile TaxID=1969806 RepID=UPI0023A84022|nr:4-hydroxyproline epimerase [Acidibrevibacterium fodinaquatile]MCA7120295.1 4-hydroxyproline epimerase [Acidibrevibacterium fodinaquatile]